MRVHILEDSVYNVYITNQFQTTFARERGQHTLLVEVTVNSKEENSFETFVAITSKNSGSAQNGSKTLKNPLTGDS